MRGKLPILVSVSAVDKSFKQANSCLRIARGVEHQVLLKVEIHVGLKTGGLVESLKAVEPSVHHLSPSQDFGFQTNLKVGVKSKRIYTK